jgi:hypothetical protein
MIPLIGLTLRGIMICKRSWIKKEEKRMKVIAKGYNPHFCGTLLYDDILDLDGFRLYSVDLFITNIECIDDVNELIKQLEVVREGFVK